MANRQYIGARYVPIIMGEWDKTLSYEALNIVTYKGNSFTSKKTVPQGTEIDNTEYWVNTGNYNAQIEEYKEEVLELKEKIHPKKYLLISDSYGNYVSSGVKYSWCENVIKTLGINGVNLSQGDIGFRPSHDGISSFMDLLTNAIIGGILGDLTEYTDIVLCGGANDIVSVATEGIDKDGLIENIGNFVTICKNNFPNATVTIGMIGNIRSANYAWSYDVVIEAYRQCIRFGAKYLTNSEYILTPENIKESDGIHPTPNGFNELSKYLCEGVVYKSCNVNRAIIEVPLSITLGSDIGAWNLVPALNVSQINGIYRVTMNRQGICITLTEGNRVDLTNLRATKVHNNYKLFDVGRPIYCNLKGSNFDIKKQVYYLPNVSVTLVTTQLKYITINVPLALIQGVFYICLPKENALLQNLANDNEAINGELMYIYLNPFDITVDTSNYQGC